MIRIILVDDHQIVRDGIRSLLEGNEHIIIAGEASGGSELTALLSATAADIILLDVSMPGESGIDICRRIKTTNPEIKVLILSMYSGEEFIVQSLLAGASGYLPKNTSREELLNAIARVHQGEVYIGHSLSETYINSLMRKAQARQEAADLLSRRETEILRLCAEGLTNKEIADSLYISTRTVESHKTHIMQKLDLKTVADMIRFAIKNRLVDL
ncbi:MAG TPA: response regulator transcription factor [Bacteroidales bacterium]|nr:response regulator transcription factor [Bacteroidales bacterium]HSA42429.1 response regulator transcription factor [Bacteroidales bacterium]